LVAAGYWFLPEFYTEAKPRKQSTFILTIFVSDFSPSITNCDKIHKMVYRSIGIKIQQARQELGLTQEELATRLGCTQAALSNYELGKRRVYLAGLEQIADTLGKPLSYFLESIAGSDEDDSQNWHSRYPYR
jgi:DNA-binding XRE family transcriptional regulator